MAKLWPIHWEEVANNKDKIPLDVHFEAYELMAQTGELHIVTARHKGVLVGYHWSIIRPHLHYYSTLHAFTDICFLLPEYRTGMNGVLLMKAFEDTTKVKGVKKLFTGSKVKFDKSPIFERLDWVRSEVVYTKWIGD